MFDIIACNINGVVIQGFTVKDTDTHETKSITVEDAYKLIDKQLIKNAKAVEVDYTKVLCIDNYDELLNQKSSGSMTVTARIKNKDGKCVGYKVKGLNGKNYTLSPNKVWELTAQGKVTNMKCEIYNGTKIIRGKDIEIADLPVITA